jgi:hypothetical protein
LGSFSQHSSIHAHHFQPLRRKNARGFTELRVIPVAFLADDY